MMTRVVVTETERAFVYVDGAFEKFLGPGRHWIVRPFRAVSVKRVSTLEPKLVLPDIEVLAKHPEVGAAIDAIRIADHERGLVFRGEPGRSLNFTGFLAPGFHAFLKVPHAETRVEIVDATTLELEHAKRDTLVRGPNAAAFLRTIEVPDGHKGVLFVDWARTRVIGPGRHFFWTGLKEISAIVVDTREQTLEVQGQELMTQDKVSLRINLTARFRVADLEKVLDGQANWREALYRELQLALRDEVGVKTLDLLLSDKEKVRTAVVGRVKSTLATFGIELTDAGIRDVILPGEMRTIFNQVIEAEKRAEAGLIARREETAATRNLLNTAKLLESNPILMRLKELEATEKIAEKIGSLQIVGGMEAMMQALGGASRINGVPK